MFTATCNCSLCFLQKLRKVLIIYVNTLCTVLLTIVEVPNKPQLNHKIGGEAQGYSNVEENRTRVFPLKPLAKQISQLLTRGASQTVHLKRVCSSNK